MKAGKISLVVFLVCLLSAGLGASSIQGGMAQEQPVYLMLQAGTFDPLQGEPLLPAGLTMPEYPDGTPGAYIVQFKGPVQEDWKEQLAGLGGKVLDYLPDYAFVVWMDGTAREQARSMSMPRRPYSWRCFSSSSQRLVASGRPLRS